MRSVAQAAWQAPACDNRRLASAESTVPTAQPIRLPIPNPSPNPNPKTHLTLTLFFKYLKNRVMVRWVLGLGLGFGFGNLIGGAVGTVYSALARRLLSHAGACHAACATERTSGSSNRVPGSKNRFLRKKSLSNDTLAELSVLSVHAWRPGSDKFVVDRYYRKLYIGREQRCINLFALCSRPINKHKFR